MVDRVRVIGVGNPDRGDDGVGPAVAARVAAESPPDVGVVVSIADPTRLIDRWSGADVVVVIDAVVDGSEPGTVTVLDAIDEPIPPDAASVSSHGMGLAAAIELGRSLDRLPEHLTVVGVTAETFEGVGLSEGVDRAVADATEIVLEVARNA